MDLVIHTPGGLVLAAEQIAEALVRRKGRVTVFVPHYAMSGGSLIAMAADEIVMDANAVLGPVDPQVGQYPAASILKVVEQKPISEVDDQILILADVGRKALEQVRARGPVLDWERHDRREGPRARDDASARSLDARLPHKFRGGQDA